MRQTCCSYRLAAHHSADRTASTLALERDDAQEPVSRLCYSSTFISSSNHRLGRALSSTRGRTSSASHNLVNVFRSSGACTRIRVPTSSPCAVPTGVYSSSVYDILHGYLCHCLRQYAARSSPCSLAKTDDESQQATQSRAAWYTYQLMCKWSFPHLLRPLKAHSVAHLSTALATWVCSSPSTR